ncbi:hypothetical protein [Nakamurella lactea]|uniref:hypothetical protein n=1 Tax=Nakamurella lactea TaxID=459515 RepID=UPI0004910C85|nr:hypothetical protein [Nakamurella lactea]
MFGRRLLVPLGIALFLASSGLSTATAAPAADNARARFVSSLDHAQSAKFAQLSQAQQNEAVAVFSDPLVLTGALTAAQVSRQYPGAAVTDSTAGSRAALPAPSAGTASMPLVVTPSTIYSVHWYYSHTVTFLWFSNTARLDYYYYTNASTVTSDQRCTWTDSGVSVNDIDNLQVDHWVSSGYGYCYATVQISASFWVSAGVSGHGYVYQDMKVNGSTGAIWTYFHEVAP